MKEIKGQELTKKELIALCKKQEEYIEELKEKLKKFKDTEKCESEKPDYNELCRQVQSLNNKIFKLEQENEALRYSLTETYKGLKCSQTREEMYEEYYYKADKRSEKLFDELEKLNREKLEK